jgi:hypothetical protein
MKLNKSIDAKAVKDIIKTNNLKYAAINFSNEEIENIIPRNKETLLITRINKTIKIKVI